MPEMAGKTCVVTGGAQGIGKAIARQLLDAGAKVVIADIDAEAGRETEQEYANRGELLFVEADVAGEEAVRGLVQKAVDRFGRLDGLVNNAGISAPGHPPLEEHSLADWERVLGVNLTSCFLCAKHAAKHLRATRGAIVNIASTRAQQSEANTFAYSATKGGIVALTHSLAVSLGPEVLVNCISPGWIETREWKKSSERETPELSQQDHAQHPAGRVGKPEDIAAMALYLLSPKASFITGHNFTVDGGMTRKMIYED